MCEVCSRLLSQWPWGENAWPSKAQPHFPARRETNSETNSASAQDLSPNDRVLMMGFPGIIVTSASGA